MFRKLRDRIAFWRWYLLEFRPIAGADGADEGGDDGDGDGSAADSEGDDDNDGDGSGDGSGSGDGDGDDDASGSGAGDGGDDDNVTLPKGEVERLRREVADAAKKERERKRKAAEEAGDHQKVVQGVEEERDEKDRELEDARKELAQFKAQVLVTKIASNLNFHDAEDAVLRVPAEVAEKGEAAIEKHLRDLIKKSPHLVGEGSPRSGAPVGGGNGGGGGGGKLTKADVQKMSRDEMAKHPWADIQAAMAEES
jgi:hypothetical protein